jgi:tRNA-guanine family transglycosylase
MRNKLSYVVAGSEALFRNGQWVFDLKTMPVDVYLYNATCYVGGRSINDALEQKKQANEKGKLMMCDSGGFQFATEVVKDLDPIGIIEIQNRIADLGFILDISTSRRVRGAGASGLELDSSDSWHQHCLERTQKHIRAAKDVEKKFKYYAVIQGATYDQAQKWWDGIKDEDTYQGVGTKRDLFEQILFGCMMIDKMPSIKYHHILGLGATNKMLLLRYFYLCSKKDMVLITMDNTSHVQYAKYMQLKLPFSGCCYSKTNDLKGFEELSGLKFNQYDIGEVMFTSIRNIYFDALHVNMINMLDTADSVKDFIDKNFPQLMTYVNAIDDYFDKGFEYVTKRYFQSTEKHEVHKQKSSALSFLS